LCIHEHHTGKHIDVTRNSIHANEPTHDRNVTEPCVDMAVTTFDQFLCLPCDVDEPVCAGKRAIDSNECAICEPCAPSKMPKLRPSEEDDDDYVDEEDDGDTALDTPDFDPMPKGSKICVFDGCGKWSSWGPINGARNSACFCSSHGKAHGGCERVGQKRCAATPCNNSAIVTSLLNYLTLVDGFGKPEQCVYSCSGGASCFRGDVLGIHSQSRSWQHRAKISSCLASLVFPLSSASDGRMSSYPSSWHSLNSTYK